MKRVGIVGCGSIARVHAWALKSMGETVVAVCDLVPERAEELKVEYHFTDAIVYKEFDTMLAESSIEVLHICTPHFLHEPMAVKALSRNIAVFMEKPVVISREQLDQLSEAVGNSKTPIGFCFQNRYNATTIELDRLINSKELGEVTGAKAVVTWRRDEGYYKGSPWKGKVSTEGGGTLINQSIHTLDLLLRYLGEPIQLKASMTNHHTANYIEVEDTVEARMEFSGGKIGLFYASNGYVTDAPITLEVQCENGRITLTDHYLFVWKDEGLKVISCEEHKGIGKGYWGGGHLACIKDFYQTLSTGTRFQNDLDGVLNIVKTTLKIYEEGRINI